MTKQQWRSALLQQRRARPVAARQSAQSRITAHLSEALDAALGEALDAALGEAPAEAPAEALTDAGAAALTDPGSAALRRPTPVRTVCAYLPLPSEPLEPTLPQLLVQKGFRVLVPVTQHDGPLEWCELGAADAPLDFAVGAFGIAEPTGPRLGPAAIISADIVLLPALAVDVHGTRLGRGKGHYDRSLALLESGHRGSDRLMPRLVAVLFDGEVVPNLPAEEHDVPVTDVVTPTAGWQRVVGDIASNHVAQQGPNGALLN